jgi:RNA polymerase sigma factor (sigma-70 family)
MVPEPSEVADDGRGADDVGPRDATPPVDSFEEFFNREKGELFGALALVTRNRHEAEELAQDAFVRLFERWDRVREMDDPRGYLYRTAMNAFRSRYRRAVLAARRGVGLIRPDDDIAAVDARDAAVRALATLSPRQRAAVVLVDLLGFPSEEAARVLGIRASTVRMHTSRAHALLKETMRDV